MLLANTRAALTAGSQATIIQLRPRWNRREPGPVPCHWQTGGPLPLADDT